MRFSGRVLKLCSRVPEGRVTTYGEIAKAAGKPGSSRAVGQVLKRNPRPVEIPCHRVVRSDGKLGGYGGSGRENEERKKALLRREGVRIEKNKIRVKEYLYRF
jgi:O-6-methylguanine DNA methyltransferase